MPDVLLILALFASSFFFFGDALLPPEGQMLTGNDLYAFHYPMEDFAFRAYRERQLPLWNPYILSGYPQFAESQLSTFYPFMWLAALLPTSIAFALLYAFHFGLAAAGAYVLVRQLGGQRSGALLAGFVLAYSFQMTTRLDAGHLAIIMTLAWVPWCLAAIHWSIHANSWKTAPLAAIPLGLIFLIGSFNLIPVYGTIFITFGLWVAIAAWRNHQRQRTGVIIGRLVVIGVFASLLAAIQILPTLQLWRLSPRIGFNYDFSASYSMDFQNLLTLLMPSLLYNDNLSAAVWNTPGSNRLWEQALYVGMLPLFLVALSWFAGKPRWRFWSILALVGLVLALGPAGALHRIIWRLLPFLSDFRAPGRFTYLIALGAAILTGLMFDRWFDRSAERDDALTRHAQKTWLYGLAVLGAIALLAAVGQAINQQTNVASPTAVTNDLARCLLLLFFTGALLFVPRATNLSRWLLTLIALAILIFDLWGNGARFIILRNIEPQPGWLMADLALPADRNQYRVQVDAVYTQLDADVGYFHNFLNTSGYVGLYLKTSTDLANLGRGDARIARLLSARYYMYTADQNPSPAQGWRRLTSPAGVNIDERTDAQPRGFVVHHLIAIDNAKDVLQRMKASDIDLTKTALVETDKAIDCPLDTVPDQPDEVQLVEYAPQRVTLSTATAATGWLVFNDSYYPGWYANIDGTSTQIYPTDYALRGLCLPAGQHTVTFEFKPDILVQGAMISGVAWLVMLIDAIGWIIDHRQAQYRSATDNVRLL
jgi:hypothetical protein